MTHAPGSRYTLRGSTELEQRVHSLVCEVAAAVDKLVSPDRYRSLVLIGGYGRGEGGVELRGDDALPHNNLDFMLITEGMSKSQQVDCRRRVDEALAPLREAHGVGIDFGAIDARRLRHAPSLVMWYDMRFGHRTVMGDATFVPSLGQCSVERIPAWDVRNLLVNRGTLLILNDLLLARREPREEDLRTVVKHAMKAIIGYGDAFLFHQGRYHWSYVEKQRRMATTSKASETLREMYDAAIEFRFQPRYDQYVGRDLPIWMSELRETLAGVHLQCEQMRLGKSNLGWHEYLREALCEALWAESRSPRAMAKKALNLIRGPRCSVPGCWKASLGGRLAGMRGLLPILFPVISYRLQSPAMRSIAGRALGALDNSTPELRRCYLQHWGRHGDDNFASFLISHDLSLEQQEQHA